LAAWTLFGRPLKAVAPSTGGRLVYAVGDIHGHARLLDRLLTIIEADASAQAPPNRPLLIFLGDYVDRGPGSAEVIDRLLGLKADGAFEVRLLKGNHEQALLRFLADPPSGEGWTRFGGLATLASYGVHLDGPALDDAGWHHVRDRFAAALPQPHRRFYETLETLLTVGDYAFVHAGVRPGRTLDQQSEDDLLWIRKDFLRRGLKFEKVIVHGHTPTEAPEITPHRIGLDTGAYISGVLSAVRLNGQAPFVLQATTQFLGAFPVGTEP